MSFTYLDKMHLTKMFFEEFRLRMTDKLQPVLPPEGVAYRTLNPATRSLVGSVGHQPNPDFAGPQPPSALGMVLMVRPDGDGRVRCEVAGRFDVVHRYIPDYDHMRAEVIPETNGPKKIQQVPLAFRRYTVSFENAVLEFDAGAPGKWVEDAVALPAQLTQSQDHWRTDERVFRLCRTTDTGGARYYFNWDDERIASQEALNRVIYREIFDDPDKVMPYDVRLRGRLRRTPPSFANAQGAFLVEVYLENQVVLDQARAYGLDMPFLLDAGFTVNLQAGSHIKVPHRLQPEDYRLLDEDGLPGYGITCAIKQLPDGRFATDTVPTVAQPRVEAPDAEEVGMTMRPTYIDLASDPMPVLDTFVAALEEYDKQWDKRIASFDPKAQAAQIAAAQSDRSAFLEEVEAVKDGVELLRRHDKLQASFRWMNEAMSCAITLQKKQFDSWHLFQLGFILTQVRAVYERHAPEAELTGIANTADVLWFATGGGKTEAYLGIVGMAMLYARTMNRSYGATAWMRFPLRMLSVQQFQRLSYVVAQANVIRQRECLGGHPFTVGYFTGDGTPNNISSTSEGSRGTFLPWMSDEKLQTYQFISDCPYCGTEGSITLARDNARARLKHVCSEPECWSNCDADPGSYGEGIRGEIGIYVSDEECYRYLPSVMVGTIDKLAVLAHNRRFAGFFGAHRYFCPEHGFTLERKCGHRRIVAKGGDFESADCGNTSRSKPLATTELPAMRDPGFPLLIQDELHLLRESLGNFDAHYETALAALQVSFGGRTPKVLAATATIKEFEQHVHNLYMKRARRFPAPGVTKGESFYARKRKDPNTGEPLVRRWFAGVLPISRGNVANRCAAEISSRFLDQVDEWRARLRDCDPALLATLGLAPERAGQALQYLERYLNTDLVYVNKKRSIPEILRFIEESNEQKGVERQHFQLDGDSTLDSILGAIHHVERKAPDDQRRHILATNVVSHGVDIAELNFMVVAGWPASTAEYIQASARSGRVHPGIVLAVLSPNKLFESNVFLNFGDYHFFLDALVDSVPINRFAPNILDRTLPGIMAAVILNWAKHQTGWGDEIDYSIKGLKSALTAGPHARMQIERVVMLALEVPPSLQMAFDPRVLSDFRQALKERVKGALHRLENWSPGKFDKSIVEALGEVFEHAPMRSFRDIENQIPIKYLNADGERVIEALGR